MKSWLFIFVLLLISCEKITDSSVKVSHLTTSQTHQNIVTEGKTIQERFNPPQGFQRTNIQSNSFADYLRNLPLKPENAQVKYYNGAVKPKPNVYCAVVDLPIGNRNLHQCADAVMRLRAEYLWNNKKYDKIHFNFTNGFNAEYGKWRKGKRISVKGNTVRWTNGGNASDSYQNFWKYMEMVFAYAGTLSLEKELKSIELKEMHIGDVLIQGGSPGHAVIVVDMAENDQGEKVFMLAQSYMPAQELQVLINPKNLEISPWYSLTLDSEFNTPEWRFDFTDLKRFE